MTEKLSNALNNVEISYGELIEIGNSILNPILQPVNDIIAALNNNINSLTIDQLRDYILRLQLKAYEISDIKEKSALKADLADAIQKEQFAIHFSETDGAAAVKDKAATIATSSEIIADVLYKLVANLMKSKLDQVHRMIDSLKSILTSRMQEIKFMQLSMAADGSNPYQTNRQILNE